MRKCEKCGTVMRADLRLKVNGGGYGIVVDVDEKQKTTTIDEIERMEIIYTFYFFLPF